MAGYGSEGGLTPGGAAPSFTGTPSLTCSDTRAEGKDTRPPQGTDPLHCPIVER